MSAESLDKLTRKLILTVVSRLKPSEFAFSVEVAGIIWDVYWFTARGKPGTTAIRLTEDHKAVIGLFRAGHLDEALVVAALKEDAPN